MAMLEKAFLWGICSMAWVVGFGFSLIACVGVIGLLYTIIGKLFAKEDEV